MTHHPNTPASRTEQAAPSFASGVERADTPAAYWVRLVREDGSCAWWHNSLRPDRHSAELIEGKWKEQLEGLLNAGLRIAVSPIYLAAPGAAIAAREQKEWMSVTPEQHSEAFAAGDLMALAEEAGGARMAENVVQVTRSDIERIIDFAKGRQEAAAASDIPLGAIENGRMYVERIEQEGFECEAGRIDMCSDWQELRRCFEHLAGWALSQRAAPVAQAFQARVKPWLLECFGEAIAGDREERNHRFLEEALELVQACGCTASEAHQLVDYTFGRPVGEKGQEVGGVMVTLAALCLAQDLDMHAEGETELARISVPELVARIRAKQAAKPKHSPLPAAPEPDDTPLETGEADAR